MTTLLRNAFIFTGTPAGAIADGAMVIDQGRISWLGPQAAVPVLAERPSVIDAGGRVVIPGLVNTHAHGGLGIHRGCCDDGDLFEWAVALSPHTSHLTLEDNRWGCVLAVLEMVRNGITTACDCTRYGAGLFADVASEIGMRSLSGALANSPALRAAGRSNWPLALDETREAIAVHAKDPLARFYLGAHSPYNCTPELLVEVRQAARDLGLPFTIHVAENRKETDIIRERHGTTPVRHLHDLGLLDDKCILAHCIWLDDEELDILAATGAGVAHNPVSNAKLASGVARVPEMRRRGIPVGLGTDSTLSNNSLSIFQEMKTSVLLQRAISLDGFSLSASDAFSMATAEGAKVLGWQDDIGSLEVGKAADLVLLDLDHPLGLTETRVLSDLVYAAGPQHVHSVMVNGELIYRDRAFTRVDEADLRRRLHAHYHQV